MPNGMQGIAGAGPAARDRMRVLAGDIGGTNARIAIIEWVAGRARVERDARLPSEAYSGLAGVVDAFLDGAIPPPRACFAVAGPIRDGRCRATNLSWQLDEVELGQAIGVPRTKLINDFEAIGHALDALAPEDVAEIKPGVAEPDGVIGIIGPGTGLGEGFVARIGGRVHVFAAEGGHATFAPTDPKTFALASDIAARYGHASWERILSGPGLTEVYRFLASSGDAAESDEVLSAMQLEDHAAVITRFALENSDRLCVETLDIFVTALGAEAGNLALKVGATGGIYIAGGIAPRMLQRLEARDFVAAFTNKGRLSAFLEAIPIRVILEPNAGLLGAAEVAANL
jgi:glucokinase